MPACTQYQEWSIEDNQGWAKEIYEPALEVKEGSVSVTDAPGWGISIMPSYLSKADKRVSSV
jgi:L-alanine-DL-glutamate epimerase-like enolase superfamily enzyme